MKGLQPPKSLSLRGAQGEAAVHRNKPIFNQTRPQAIWATWQSGLEYNLITYSASTTAGHERMYEPVFSVRNLSSCIDHPHTPRYYYNLTDSGHFRNYKDKACQPQAGKRMGAQIKTISKATIFMLRESEGHATAPRRGWWGQSPRQKIYFPAVSAQQLRAEHLQEVCLYQSNDSLTLFLYSPSHPYYIICAFVTA